MASKPRLMANFRPSLAFILLAALLGMLWLAGGASQAGVLGQAVVRTAAWAAIILFFLFGERVSPIAWPVALLMGAALAIALLQIIPLPPAVWQALPGRQPLIEAAVASGQTQPWRPLSIVPDATLNAAFSLVVPFAVLLLVVGLRENEQRWLPGMLLIGVLLSSLVGLLQFSGAPFDNPFVNDSVGEVDGTFANRNHFAMFTALGCLIAPVWAFSAGSVSRWRAPTALGLLLLFALTILASGSRAGIIVGGLGIVIGLVLAWSRIRRRLTTYPRWVTWVLVAGVVAAIGIAVLLSVAAGRAVSINRVFVADTGTDMRVRALPTVLAMVQEYFPFGAGLGTFDPVFRMHEPLGLLKPTYLNHVHNDWLEIVLDTGLAGLLLLLAAVGWWLWASVQAWWLRPDRHHPLPRLGSAMLLLIFVASIFDYPLRTPMMMAMAVIAGIWLNNWSKTTGSSALPASKQHL
ncbi:O-antigen ligase family protein [Sphingomonas cannabina]|uniref:O-antigen ligase family protein n=1 Tax=Sphingomonas cannabina TaxID=2899123 RepID=UPI001F32DB87|nr:O-antigen ligase family protein [Sphingomonas cannabina]UIJ44425.1 O-antigen ligase family protein [Sphingomonas cannabina]